MIVFASCVGYPDKLAAHAAPGLARSMGRHSYVHLARASNGKDIFPVYQQLIARAREWKAEALVLMHDDLEFCDDDLAAKVRAVVAQPGVAIAGLIGARNVTSLKWWEGERAGRVTDSAYGLHDFGFDRPEVDSVDGMCLVLSPWAIENLTLDGLGYEGFHGYDAELCSQARSRGKRVVVTDIRAFHHSKGGYAGDPAAYERAEAVWRWRSRWPGTPGRAAMIQAVREAGTDSLAHFGGGYTHEGGLYLQQNPEEFADLALLLKAKGPHDSFLEIGSASGGACRFLHDHVGFRRILSMDDGKHPRAHHQDQLEPMGTRRFTGDSHSHEARDWLLARREHGPIDVAFIDGDHSYEGVTKDIAMVLPLCRKGSLIVLHDIVACDGVKRAWDDLVDGGKVAKVAEFIGADKPLGIGVAEVV